MLLTILIHILNVWMIAKREIREKESEWEGERDVKDYVGSFCMSVLMYGY